jgi:hypothetical protein
MARDEGEIEKNQDASVPSHGTRTEQAETRTKQAMRRASEFLGKPFLQERFLTSLSPRADGGQPEFRATPIVD